MLDEMYKAVKDFNTIAGNTATDYKGFKTQQKVVFEECIKEVEEALDENNVVKLLDGVVDGLYVVMGQLHKLELIGCDIQGAIKQVCEDNAKKFPKKADVAQTSILHYNSQNINASYTYNTEYKCYVIKDSNGKIRKPVGFTSTDLTEYVPEEVQKKGIV